MDTGIPLPDPMNPDPIPSAPPPSGEPSAWREESERLAMILEAGAGYPELQQQARVEGWDRRQLELAVVRASRFTGCGIAFPKNRPAGPEVLEASLCLSSGMRTDFLKTQFDERTLDAALSREHRGASLHTLLFATIQAAGIQLRSYKVTNETIRTALEADRMLRASGSWGPSTSGGGLTGLISNVANKTLLEGYQAVQMTWPLFCDVESNSDFKVHERYRLTNLGSFEIVPPGGEIRHGQLDAEKYTSKLGTWGQMIGLDRQMIINDDLGAFTAVPRALGRQAAIAVEKAVYTLLLSNSGNFFSAANKNLLTGPESALSIASLTAAEQLFLDQVDANGDPTLIMPEILLTPTSLSVTAAGLVNDTNIVIAGGSTERTEPSGNPHAGRFTPAVSAYLNNAKMTGNSATAWYLLARPRAGVAVAEVAFLDGKQSPTIETAEADFNMLGVATRAYHDFGVALRDHRAGVKATGDGAALAAALAGPPPMTSTLTPPAPEERHHEEKRGGRRGHGSEE